MKKEGERIDAAELTAWQTAHGYTQTALAQELGVSRRTVIRWLQGESKVPNTVPLALRELERTKRKSK